MFNFNIIEILQNFIVLFTAITVHEYAHGWVACKLGDPTAKAMGRLTLNPMAHLDPLGALMMVFCRFGWAKPVPVNPYYFKNPKKDMVLVSVAGPLANIALAFISCTIYPILYLIAFKFGVHDNVSVNFILDLFISCASLNVCFAVFNLIPFPPLDGSKILFSVLPNDYYNKLLTYEHYGTFILIALSITGVLSNILGVVISPVLTVFQIWINFLVEVFGGILF